MRLNIFPGLFVCPTCSGLTAYPGLLMILVGLAIAQNSERSCPCTYGGIWLDIVAVIDNSVAMTTAGLAQVRHLCVNTV